MVVCIGRNFLLDSCKIDFGNWFWVVILIFFIEGFFYLLINFDVVIVGFYLDLFDVVIYFVVVKMMVLVYFVFFLVKVVVSVCFFMFWVVSDKVGFV